MISSVRKIVLPVQNLDDAIAFWVNKLGFQLAVDEQYGDQGRWVEVVPPDRALSMILSLETERSNDRRVSPNLPTSPVFFNCSDILKTHAELRARGVTFAKDPERLPFGWWAMFEDDAGRRYALGQWDNA